MPDNSCDAVFSNGLLQYLNNPGRALREMYRVLKPRGIAGVRAVDFDGRLWAPTDALLAEILDLTERLRRHNGGDPGIGKRLRALVREAGFCRVVATASYNSYGTAESIQTLVEVFAQSLEGSVGAQLVQLGWIDSKSLANGVAAWRRWGEHPDAFLAIANGEAVGWKD